MNWYTTVSGAWRWLLTPRRRKGFIHVLIWWELRRIPYNIIVLFFGLIGLGFVSLMLDFAFPSHPTDVEVVPFLVIPPAAFVANACYCTGWIFEILCGLFSEERARNLAPGLWMGGLAFSIGICMIPGVAEFLIFFLRQLTL
ncbi:MAG: hypothetical protein PHR35_18155 [Kiritimatiellae bacterium]|nr:hypothetical protein [Kiritimatiellia bacterium]